MHDASLRPPVAVIVLAWNAWETTQACLDSLRPTLRPTDELIVVDNGSSDGTAAGLAARDDVTVLSNAENLGFARGCNQGAAAASSELLVFLNNDTVVAPGWLEDLAAPFVDPLVVATGPRSNAVSGPQLAAPVPYRSAPGSTFGRFTEQWRALCRGRTSEVARLVGFCLAVRQEAFLDVGGFDERFGLGGYEDDDLCRKLSGLGWKLVIAHEAFVHHEGHVTFDANGIDWAALEVSNSVRFEDKWRASVA